MKIRLEPHKTTLRLSKVEFTKLLNDGNLSEKTDLPGGSTIEVHLFLKEQQSFKYKNNLFHFELPNQVIRSYKPSKTGLSFYFQLDTKNQHEFLFEVDIKKKPLNN